ncbi:MAG: ribosome biogenesis factor YjgA [Steroidobacteraceae bacterium]
MSDDDFDDRPSKSARKRAAHAAQDLGTRLIGLRESDLAALDLPEPLLDAVREAQRLTSRAALARQRQFIGRLMRRIDAAPIEAALAARTGASAADSELQKRIERWRERLLAEGESALDALEAAHPPIDRMQLAALASAARNEHGSPASRTTASRALFRALRALVAGPAGR